MAYCKSIYTFFRNELSAVIKLFFYFPIKGQRPVRDSDNGSRRSAPPTGQPGKEHRFCADALVYTHIYHGLRSGEQARTGQEQDHHLHVLQLPGGADEQAAANPHLCGGGELQYRPYPRPGATGGWVSGGHQAGCHRGIELT